MKKCRIQVVMEQDEDGKFVASCPSLPSCYNGRRRECTLRIG